MFSDKNGNGQVEVSSGPELNEVLEEHHYCLRPSSWSDRPLECHCLPAEAFSAGGVGTWLKGAGRENQYRYNGKELNEDFGLGWYDYGARWYDPASWTRKRAPLY